MPTPITTALIPAQQPTNDYTLETSGSFIAVNNVTTSYGVKWEVNGVPQTILPHPPANYTWR